MKVYIAAAGYNYEGWETDTIRVFTNEAEAHAYGKSLVTRDVDEWPFDFYEVIEKEVE